MTGRIYNRQFFEQGRTIFKAGEIPYCAYLIQSGAVDVVVGSEDNQVIVDTLRPGDVLGGMSLVDTRPRITSAVANSPMTGVLISEGEFQKHLNGAGMFTRWMLQVTARRLRHALQT